MVYVEVDLPIIIGSQVFDSNFYVMDIRSAYSCLLGRLWIHGEDTVTSTLHQKLKYPVVIRWQNRLFNTGLRFAFFVCKMLR